MDTGRLPLAVASMIAGVLVAQPAWAERISGEVSYIGTQSEYHTADSGYQAVFRFRVSNSTCGNDNTPRDRWLHVRSGRMDGAFAHNAANLKNAYSTVMTSLLTGKIIEIDGVPGCDAAQVQTINLWQAAIGLYK